MAVEVWPRVLVTPLGLGPTTKLVLLGLCNHGNPDGTEQRPKIATLAAYAECDERTVQRHLRILAKEGWIEVTQKAGRGRATTYQTKVDRLSPLGKRVTPAPEKGDTTNQKGDTGTLKNGQETSSKTAIETSILAAPSANGHRKRDELFETMVEILHWTTLTPGSRGKINAALKSLRTLDPIPDAEDIRLCARALLKTYPGMVLTPHAIETNFSAWAGGQLVGRGR